MSARPDLSSVDAIGQALANLINSVADGSAIRGNAPNTPQSERLVPIATAIDAAEAEDIRDMLDARTRELQNRVTAARAGEAAGRDYWERRELVHKAVTVKLLAALIKAGFQ